MDRYHTSMLNRRVLVRRLLIGLAVLAISFLLDRHAYSVLRTITLYDHWGEMREGLTTAKFIGSGLGTLLVGLIIGSLDRRGWRRAAALWLVVVVAGAAGGVVKMATGRERPSHEDQKPGEERLAFHGPAMGLRHAPFQSFPSGHTLSMFASATCLATYYPPARVVFYTIAVATGVNRVAKHQHFLSDTVAGALLGHLLALWLLNTHRLRRLWAPPDVDREPPPA